MNKQRKKEVLEMMESILSQNHLYIVDCQGLTANQAHQLRAMLYKENIGCRVIPNTLLRILFQGTDREQLSETLKKTSMVLMTKENPSIPARVLQKFHKATKLKVPEIKGAFAYGEIFIGIDQLNPLAKLKSKEELIGEIINILQAPMQQILGGLQSEVGKIHRLLKTIASE
ncbi:MAG: 50S ribosomal protein L10 [Bacteroidota bacterium]